VTVRFHPAARDELREARLWYEDRSPLSAVAFAHEIDVAVSRIAEAPTRYPVAEHGTRRVVLPRFPYDIFYRIGQRSSLSRSRIRSATPGHWSDR
jgi:plasmid stabilization system protein ParE